MNYPNLTFSTVLKKLFTKIMIYSLLNKQ